MRERLPTWVMGGILLAVPLGLALVLPAPSSDTRELLSWGLNPSLSTPKQPPLMQWMGFLVMRFAWPTTFWCAALTQALNAAGLAYTYATMRLFSPRAEAALATLALAGAVYFLGAPVAFALNADILQFPFWAATLFHALRAFETRRAGHWAALALAFALAFYAKYTVALFALSLASASAIVPEYRRVWRDARLYLTAAGAALLIAPHLWAAPHSGAVGHATGALRLAAPLSLRLADLFELALGFLAYLAPSWLIVGAGIWRGHVLLIPAQQPEARFVRAVFAVSVALLAFLVVVLGFKYPSRYDSPFLFLAWIALASALRFAPQRLAGTRAWVMGAVGAFAAVVLAGGLLIYGVFTIHPRQQEPLPEAAARLLTEWRARFACGPAYVMGDFWSAYGLGPSMLPPRPGVHLTEMEAAPGYDPALRETEGAMIVYRGRLDAAEIRAALPGLDLSAPERLTLPFARTLSRKATMTYEYVFVPPKRC